LYHAAAAAAAAALQVLVIGGGWPACITLLVALFLLFLDTCKVDESKEALMPAVPEGTLLLHASRIGSLACLLTGRMYVGIMCMVFGKFIEKINSWEG
jgi:hypothetical protein